MTRFREHPRADWLPFEDALTRILARAPSLPVEHVQLDLALGRALAQPVTAPLTLPPLDNSAMDGFAVRGEDIAGASPDSPVALEVVGASFPGAPWTGTLGPGQSVRIMTGGPVPNGADTVIRVEDTDGGAQPGRVAILDDRDLRRHVRPRGEDMQEGDTLLEAGAAILSERRVYAPYGLAGGEDGARGQNLLLRKGGQASDLDGKNQVAVSAGDRLRILTPGGGGYGPAGE